jgi:hypothetical protein
MSLSEIPCLSLVITRLTAAESGHYALWVINAPYPSGYVHHDRLWTMALTKTWETWQGLFSLRGLPLVPRIPSAYEPELVAQKAVDGESAGKQTGYTSRLMQHLGVELWHWLFDGPIQSSLDRSQGIAIGQGNPLRLRLEIRDPELTAIPWEIMQPQAGKQAISLSQQILFSRTTSDVDPLPALQAEQSLKILLVLGYDGEDSGNAVISGTQPRQLKLEQEAEALASLLTRSAGTYSGRGQSAPVPCHVTTLLRPTPADLTEQLESESFNIFFYAGHGMPAPDGGLLYLQKEATLNGTELAQVLTRCRVKLAVFNACWGAQPDQQNQYAIPRSSLAEVLIHHGVPAVLGMRDSIADREALSFIQVFAQALAERSPIDEAVAIARQHLLTLYKFNQPAWTLPVLYMHPEFDGELIHRLVENVTEIPRQSTTWINSQPPAAYLRLATKPDRRWPVQGGIMRVGSSREHGNDLVLEERGVSRKHAEIFCRNRNGSTPTYFLRDFSRYGTYILTGTEWQRIHNHEMPLDASVKLRFGSSQGQTVEFIIEE